MTEQRTRHVVYGIWLIIAGAVGWWAAFQLTVEKFAKLADPDAMSNCYFSVILQCDANLNSWQGSVFGFPNPIIGVSGWIAVIVMGVALLAGSRFPRWFWALFGAGITFAFGFVCWLIGQSIYDLHTLCPWCMVTWAVTIPTFFATMLHLTRNGTFTRSAKAQQTADRLMAWVPLAAILAYAVIVLLAQLQGLDLLGEVFNAIF
jgi:uncharacterized membrane protein